MTLSKNFEALEFARSLGIMVAINLIADPGWDRRQFEVIRQWCLEIPEIVNISVNTPYPGTESWLTESRRLTTRDYRLFDIQHAVLPTRLPLAEFYVELVRTQQVLNRKHLGWRALKGLAGISRRQPRPGPDQHAEDALEVQQRLQPGPPACRPPPARSYEMSLPPERRDLIDPRSIYVHSPRGRHGRSIDDDTEQFVEQTRMHGSSSA